MVLFGSMVHLWPFFMSGDEHLTIAEYHPIELSGIARVRVKPGPQARRRGTAQGHSESGWD